MVTRPLRVERWKNDGSTTLSSSASAGAGTVSVTSASNFPTSGDFRIIISGSEEVIVTSVSGTTLTLSANLASSHSSGASVVHVPTSSGMGRMMQDLAGEFVYPWNRILSGATTKVAADFTWLNQGSATCTDADDGGLNMTMPSEAATQIRGKYISAPSTPWTVTARLEFGPGYADGDGSYFGIMARESSSSKLYLALLKGDNLALWRMTNETTFSALVDSELENQNDAVWLQLMDDGTNIRAFASYDGYNFLEFWNEGRTSFMGGGADQIGFFACSNTTSTAAGAMFHIKSWIVT